MPATARARRPAHRSRSTPRRAADAVRLRQPVPPELRIEPRRGRRRARRADRRAPPRRGTRCRRLRRASTARSGSAAGIARVGADAEVASTPTCPAARRLARAVAQRAAFASAGLPRAGRSGSAPSSSRCASTTPDDDIRQVNWRATARLGRPMSNQFRVERDRDVICLVDCGRLMAAPVGDRTRLDVALDGVLAVARVADELGDRCGAIAFDDAIRANLPPRRRGAATLVARAVRPRAAAGRERLRSAPSPRSWRRSGRSCSSSPISSTRRRRARCSRRVPVLARRHAVDGRERHRPGPRGIVQDDPAAAGRRLPPGRSRSTCSPAGRRVRHLLRRAGADVVETEVGALLRPRASGRICGQSSALGSESAAAAPERRASRRALRARGRRTRRR